LPLVAESYTDITQGMNNIQNLHVVTPQKVGEIIKPSTIPQPNDNHKKYLLIVGNCWQLLAEN